MPNKLTLIFIFILSHFLITPAILASDTKQTINHILAQKEAPTGVVFEIATASANSLNWALPRVQEHIKKLRNRFPELEIAIVTHGNEQFALQTKNNKKFKKIHSLTQQLVKEENVPLHVCGTYAGWKNVTEEEFPDYVDVTAAGPATINDYIALGYVLIKL